MLRIMFYAVVLTFTGVLIALLFEAAKSNTAPAQCAWPAVTGKQVAGTMASGDAGILWLPGASAYHEFVCTDGALVPVSHYGK